ncbi:tRNA 2-thiocytidine biosynthesis TtcA family protein [Candidatus Omnitrophota bacterium]
MSDTHFDLILNKVIKAIDDYKMIEKGDKVLAAVSGGKDSLSMMHLLNHIQKKGIFDFELVVCNVDLGYGCANKDHLRQHFQKHDINSILVENNMLKDKKREEITCFWCSWNRRRVIFDIARKNDCAKLSLGHHLDDIIHTALLNILFHGEISTSTPYLSMFNDTLALIRPLSYIKEEEAAEFAKSFDLPVSCCSCPQKLTSKRTLINETFTPLFDKYPYARDNAYKALSELANKSA